MGQTATNTLNAKITCPKCGKEIDGSIGFRAGAVAGEDYELGQRIKWAGNQPPQARPADGNLKTIGYFECDNLKCPSWEDCYPEIQEALVVIRNDVIESVRPFVHKPGELLFDVIEVEEVG